MHASQEATLPRLWLPLEPISQFVGAQKHERSDSCGVLADQRHREYEVSQAVVAGVVTPGASRTASASGSCIHTSQTIAWFWPAEGRASTLDQHAEHRASWIWCRLS